MAKGAQEKIHEQRVPFFRKQCKNGKCVGASFRYMRMGNVP